ncbi:helix-turn-helix domain-containing protein [Rhizobium sp. RU36D]|uniref:helix-turn-helix domain-containing protein n=1 Tax=Rhizobium sp. RU36D TaxID=1907415 RepID=UPI0009D88B6F|nr:helix-turn-helix domain-containing protein [Rhizobium sp. RU36D]SMC73287.1 CRP/FNR family transcriptional regulator, nitrogen fixation regulation protein [Rhizobium sp. RU36D]
MAQVHASQAFQAASALRHASEASVTAFCGSPASVQFLPPETEIFAQGECCGKLYRVEFGAVRVYRLLSDGRRQISAFHLTGEIFGFETDTVHQFFAETLCSTGISTLRLTSARNDMASELLPLALKSLVRTQQHLLVLGRQNALERIAAFLLDMSERQGDLQPIELPMSRIDMADYLGLTIETVSRALSRLKKSGVILMPSLRSVEIVKLQTLQSMAG